MKLNKCLLLTLITLGTFITFASDKPTAWTGSKIWTGNSDQPWAEVIVTNGNRIIAVGDKSLLKNFKGQIKYTEGALIVPGMIDNHTHFMMGAESLVAVPTLGSTSKNEFISRVAAHADNLKGSKWILGGVWDETLWGGMLPRRDWLDSVTGNHPLFLMRIDGHSAIANSKALAIAGITNETPDPKGGKIWRDKNGEPTGLLKDSAMAAVFEVLPRSTETEEDQLLSIGMDHALKKGLTQVHSVPNVLEDAGWREYTVFKRAKKNGQQKIRAVIYLPLEDRKKLAAIIAQEGKGDLWLSWPGVKAMTDGSLGSSTAWFKKPYSNDPANSGFPIQPPEELEQAIKEAHQLGLQLAIHAIGDRSNDVLLDIFERVGVKSSRPRIEHAQHLSESAIELIAELGVVPSMQPYHAIDDGRWAEKRIGKDRLSGTYAFRSLLDAGARLTFGSDWNVAPLDPIAGIYAAVTRRTLDDKNPNGWVPEQKINVAEALKAYTINNAWAVGMENELGSLEPGKLADFVVLDQDLFEITPETIKNTKVLMTVIDGKVMYPQTKSH